MEYKYIFENLQLISAEEVKKERESLNDSVKYHLSKGHKMIKWKLTYCKRLSKETDNAIRLHVMSEPLLYINCLNSAYIKPSNNNSIDTLELIVSPLNKRMGIKIVPRTQQIRLITDLGANIRLVAANDQYIHFSNSKCAYQIYFKPDNKG